MFKKILAVMLGLFCAAALIGCTNYANLPPEVTEDDIALRIQLDTKEDIGLLVVDYTVNGTEGSGGVSNADKSLIKHDERLTFTINKQHYDNPTGAVDLTVRFTVVTKYFEPNYENDYPAEYTKPMNEISLKADFGKSYSIKISGDKTSGYKAVLAE